MSGGSTYALPTGQISLNEMHVEAGGGSGAQSSINDADIRSLIGKGSAVQMSFSEWHGASADMEFVSWKQTVTTNPTGTKRRVDLGSLGIQTGDLVFVCSIAQGIGEVWPGPASTAGWTACDANQGYNNWQTSFRYYKKMGSTVDSVFEYTVVEESWKHGYQHPAIVAVFRNTGASPTNSSYYQENNQRLDFTPGAIAVSKSDSLHVIVATRAGFGSANAKTGWTKLEYVISVSQGGSGYTNGCFIWYKIGVNPSSSNIGVVTWPTGYARINSAQLIFNK